MPPWAGGIAVGHPAMGQPAVDRASDHVPATLIGVPDLLADAGRRVRAGAPGEPAGCLAVIEVRVPAGAAPEQVETVFDLVAAAAARLGARVAFDDDQGHYLLLLPLTRTAMATEELGALLHRLAAVDMGGGAGRSIRPSAGAGVVTLSGQVGPEDSLDEIDLALTEVIGLAHRSSVERALRAHWAGARWSGARSVGARSVGDDPGGPRRRRRGGRGRLRGPTPGTDRAWRGRLRQGYLRLSSRQKAWVLAVSNLVIAWLLPLVLYSGLYLVFGLDVSTVGFWVVLATVVITAFTVYAEAVLSLRPPSPPEGEMASYPSASAIVVAYLPNETGTIIDTVTCLLAQDYPGSLEVVLAYNTPRSLPIEEDLARLAAGDSRLMLLRVGDSTSKAQNINAALQVVHGEIIGIFDADHRPMATAFRRAAAWLANGVDVVQGRSVVRNGQTNWLARMVAVEFEGIYAVAHPGRAALHTFGIFGGSNGFWRAELLDRLRMHPDMLTEDIDISIRAVFDGYSIAVDPQLTSEELAPLTPMALWSQRIRWSHGWHQVSRRQIGRIWQTEALTVRQRLGASFLLGWREAYPWVAAQMVPILAFELLVRHHLHAEWVAPIFVATMVYVSAVGPVQALFAWRLSVPDLRRRHRWWWQYVLITGIVFGEFKALVSRAAHLRELLGDRAWQVTPRTSASSGGIVARLHADATGSELICLESATGTLTAIDMDLPLPLPVTLPLTSVDRSAYIGTPAELP